jgi:hypothetical protein
MNRFWAENEKQSLSPSEASLYFFLLYKANSLYWQMPIRCPTSKLCIELNVTKQCIAKARKKLKERGLIDYTSGCNKIIAPDYVITDCTDELSGQLSGQLSNPLTIYKIKTKDKNKDKNENFINSNHLHDNVERGGRRFSLKDLELRLSEDTEWLDSIHSLLSEKFPITSADVKSKLVEFFKYLRCYGYQEKSEKACRVYFLNWLNKDLIQQKNEQHTRPKVDLRRGSPVTAKSPKDYEGPF